MNKKIGILIVFLFMISFKNVSATSFYNYLPGGKNYLDENNFDVTSISIDTINSFLVKGDTFYTLTFPGTGMIGEDTSIIIYGRELYFDGGIQNEPNCNLGEQISYCTFKTDIAEDYISVLIENSSIVSYLNYYGFFNIQLEEGEVSTTYEEYIIPLVDSGDPLFLGSGAYIKSYSTFESVESIIAEHISVNDEVDGDITGNIIIESDSYTGNEQIVGEYLVELSASDSSGNTAYFNLNIFVKDEIIPVITGPDSVVYNVLGDISIMTIIEENFIIEDGYSLITINIINDSYSLNKDTIGIYSVSFEVVDQDMNTESKTFQVELVDIEEPIILSSLNINSYLSDPYNLVDVLNTLEFEDNYTDMSNANIYLIDNEFEGNEEIPGTYVINFEIGDSSDNMVESNLVINVVDDIIPQIGGPLTYQGSYTEDLTVEDFINMLNVSDNIDVLDLSNIYIVNDSYSIKNSMTGSFVITFGVKDSNLNENTHTINITVYDDIAPIIYTDNFIVTVDANSTFTTDDAVRLLINSKELIEGNYSVRTLFDGYTGNEMNEGTYVYLLEFSNSDGLSYEKEFVVNVVNEDESEINNNLLVRNIIIYSMSITIFGFVIYKNKK